MTTRPAERPLESRLKWLMFGRLAVAVVCLFAIFFIPALGIAYLPPYYALLAMCVLNLAYLVAARAGLGLKALAVVQVLLDIVLVGVLVYFTGVDRFFAFLYFAAVIGAAMILGPRMAVAAASAASIVMAGVFTLHFFAAHPDYLWRLPAVNLDIVRAHLARLDFLLPYLFFFALSLHVVAFLAGRLAHEVSRIRILNEEILQNMAGGVLAADSLWNVQFINAQAARLLGIPGPEAARGRQIDDVIPAPVSRLLRRAINKQERIETEVKIGDTPVAVVMSCLTDGEGGPLRGVVAILNDLSLRVQVEEMKRRAERFQALLHMSAGMAHEVRNPLASIRGAAQELGSGALPGGDDRRLLQIVVRESERLDKIIKDFLDYASDRPMAMSVFDMAELLREMAFLLDAREDRGRTEIVRELPPAMPCRGAADQLKQVLLNLGLNAIEACNGVEDRPGRLRIRCFRSPGFGGDSREGVRVEISDNGIGVSPADIARIFDPFFTTKPKGTGMGLAIARRIVRDHDGEILLQSEQGRGTTVRVWLPS